MEFDKSRPFVRAFAPGRTELAGNHTDHQGGRVVAATVDVGVEIIAQGCGGRRAQLESEGFAPVALDVDDVRPREDERGTTTSLVRGVVAGLRAAGVGVGGFCAQARSTIPGGSGLSSSAAFELALACALVRLADERGEVSLAGDSGSALDPVALARIAQTSERDWFGKPCGLMDQLSIALGGINEMDFAGDEPRAQRIEFDFGAAGYALALIDTHCDHSRYTHEYAQVARDMDEVARLFGVEGLSQVGEEAFLERFGEVRRKFGDLAAMRALHYYHEMALVSERVRALRAGDFEAFLNATRRSGASSAQYLQNVSTAQRSEQPAMVALALADRFAGPRGAVRIHGGGFGGTVQAFVPLEDYDSFARAIDARLGAGSCMCYSIVEEGAHAVWRG